MKKASVITGFLAFTLAAACGSQSSKDGDAEQELSGSPAPAPQAIFASPDQQEEPGQEDELTNCKALTTTSQICSYKPQKTLIAEESGLPTLVTVQYSLKCDSGKDGELSDIALRTDSQVRRLQVNAVDREITVLSRQGAVVELAKILQTDSAGNIEAGYSCSPVVAKVVKTEVLSSVAESGSSL